MKMAYVLIAVVGASAAVGAIQSLAGPSSTTVAAPSSAPLAAQAPQAAPHDDGDDSVAPPSGAEVGGEVLEVTDVPNYSYLRIGNKGTDGVWAAVPTAKLKVGDRARVGGAMKMTNFKSTSLNRTFPEIYFGSLVPEGAPPAMGANPHGAGADPHAAGAANPHGAGAGADPHKGTSTAAASVDVKAVDRATGANGKTVAEVIGQRTSLNGKSVRIHATVVKSTPGVMGKTYLHLRDGSGDAAAKTHDLTATTDATPAVGETITIEGTVALDRDIGSGYSFSTIVENGKLQ